MAAVTRILVSTDGSEAADRAIAWAAETARQYDATLLLLQVVAPENLVGLGAAQAASVETRLAEHAAAVAGNRGQPRVVFDSDPAAAILRLADEEQVRQPVPLAEAGS